MVVRWVDYCCLMACRFSLRILFSCSRLSFLFLYDLEDE